MSDGKIVHDWIDADQLRKTAEDLLKPTDEISSEEKSAATFGDDFVGFAEVKKEAADSRSLERARENLSKAQDTAASAGIIAPAASAAPKPVSVQSPAAPRPKPVPISPPSVQAKTVSQVSMPPVAKPVVAASSLPVVKPASSKIVIPKPAAVTREKIRYAGMPTQPVASVKPVLKTPFRIVTEQITREEFAKLPRSI